MTTQKEVMKEIYDAAILTAGAIADKQKRKDQEAIDKRVAKFEAEKVKETQQRERKEAAKWEKEIKQEEQRQSKLRDDQRWKGSKKLGKSRQKIKNQLTKIFKRQEDEIKSLEKAYKKFQSRQNKTRYTTLPQRGG